MAEFKKRLRRWFPTAETLEQTRTWLDGMIANGPDQPDFVIERDGQVIGKAGFYRFPTLGYIIAPAFWGRGLVLEALVRVNRELRELLLSGYVRPVDISRQNEITYDKIAGARISYGGRGLVSDVQSPRYGQELADIVLPF